jgi:hypothetical protein
MRPDARLAQLAVAHGGGDRKATHREAHAMTVHVAFCMKARDDVSHVLTTDANVESELVETHLSPA